MDTYKPGLVSTTLFVKNKNANTAASPLARLFSPTAMKNQISQTGDRSVPSEHMVKVTKSLLPQKKKKAKRKLEKVEEDSQVLSNPVSTPFPYVHETLSQKETSNAHSKPPPKKKKKQGENLKKDEENKEKRPRRNRMRNKEADQRTIFVGNCPLSADKKRLMHLFREFGDIESVRFRCAPASEPNIPRRATVIMKQFHDKCNNYVAYIVFKEEAAAQKALIRNGYLLDDFHLRVDIASIPRKDKKRTVFVGNLPFTISEENLRSHFTDCGEIINIRLVRDRLTSLGKGIGYVQFESKDSVSLAVKLDKSELQGRKLRVMVCSNKQKEKEKTKTPKKSNVSSETKAKTKKISFAPSNTSSSKFKDILKAKKEKRLRKIKKKKANAQKSDRLSSIFGDARSVPLKQTKTKKNVKLKGKPSMKGKVAKTNKKQKGKPFLGKEKMKKKKT